MTDQNWAKILKVLYDGPLFVSEDRGSYSGKDYELCGYLANHDQLEGIEADEIEFYLENLHQVDLVRATEVVADDNEESEWYGGLTPKGIEVAHERDMASRQQSATTVVAFFTFALALTATIQAAISYSQMNSPFATVVLGVALIGTLGIIVVGMWSFYTDDGLNL